MANKPSANVATALFFLLRLLLLLLVMVMMILDMGLAKVQHYPSSIVTTKTVKAIVRQRICSGRFLLGFGLAARACDISFWIQQDANPANTCA